MFYVHARIVLTLRTQTLNSGLDTETSALFSAHDLWPVTLGFCRKVDIRCKFGSKRPVIVQKVVNVDV